MTDEEERHSEALEADLIRDPDELAAKEARNGLQQFDTVVEIVEYFLHPGRKFRLRPSQILSLHRVALEGISPYAGNYRPAGIKIAGSKHAPVGAHLVPEKVEELCDYVNDHWSSRPIHLAAYVLWRLNWIHPFTDGNGRTSRAVSYAVLCIRLGYLLPGTPTIPEQIAAEKGPYYRALEIADNCIESRLDLTTLEELLSSLLANQLLAIHARATGRTVGSGISDIEGRKFH